MSDLKAFKALSLLATIGLVAVAACTIQLRGRDESGSTPKVEQKTDAANADRVNCRGVTPEETAGYRHCQQIWAENRRRFLGRKDGVVTLGRNDPTSSIPVQKDQSRIPQGYPNSVTPEANKP